MDHETQISTLKKKKSRFLANGWKQIMKPCVDTAIQGQNAILLRQAKNTQEIGELTAERNAYSASLADKPCPHAIVVKTRHLPNEPRQMNGLLS